MATENQQIRTTFTAAESLNSHQYLAVAIDDGLIANNGEEASGILLNKPLVNEFMEVGYMGEFKVKVGGAVTKGDKLTVSTSGYFTTAGSSDPVVGTAKEAITSGSLGTGFFDFTKQTNTQALLTFSITAADAIGAGRPVALNDYKIANSAGECNGIAVSAIASGTSGKIVVMGFATAVLANSYGAGQLVNATTSGYMTAAASGSVANAVVFSGNTSGTNATVFILPNIAWT